ncbi:MAG TPA: phytanoyl-CoA dioxygenase family protein [Chitinophagaceae bacterium]|nr:phytanoyl-CoA dioxygenase family protein [Chitinophagaceae bacterium]
MLTMAAGDLHTLGFTTLENIYTTEEIQTIGEQINYSSEGGNISKSEDIFSIRQLLMHYPRLKEFVFNTRLKQVLKQLPGNEYFVVKSIYFNKPAASNWFVAYHQDVSISVNEKRSLPGFTHWTVKSQQFAVQPPLHILEGVLTVRIHLDDTNEDNGALKVMPGTHLNGIIMSSGIQQGLPTEVSCNVRAGGIMLMKSLLLHSSARTTNGRPRRFIHIEFANEELPDGLQWAERMSI